MFSRGDIPLIIGVASFIASLIAYLFPGERNESARKYISVALLVVAFISFVLPEFRTPTCGTVQENFPQSLESIRNHFNLPGGEDRFELIYEGCDAVATGFIFEGITEFELGVPTGGCIDSYPGAYFSVEPITESSGGLRAYSGVVRATGMTYRSIGCEMKS